VAESDIAAFPYPDTPIYRAKCSARIVDYMSMGKAVITTAIGQNTEYIVDRQSGILVPPRDEVRFGQELEALLEDSQLRARLGENAKRRIETTFTWEGAALDSCLTAYQELSKA
jgi:glycosyltransferase involved in cell wall biosynthesis